MTVRAIGLALAAAGVALLTVAAIDWASYTSFVLRSLLP